jgi:hypothetical protein
LAQLLFYQASNSFDALLEPKITMTTYFHLTESMFEEREQLLLEAETLEASAFRFESGVAAIRLRNELGELVLLPFQGQQIWSASFRGRNITMRSMFNQPRPTRNYLETYGGFLLHCGFTAMGVPATGDTHPLHGELPNAPYKHVFLVAGKDARGSYIGLGGVYQHTVAFSFNYQAEPLVKLYAGSSLFAIDLDITNLKQTPMEYMYMAHANFRPVDNGRLVYSAHCTPATARVRTSIPSHVRPGPDFAAFLQELSQHPEKHNVLKPGLAFDPEVVFFIDYLADDEGWAHTMQVHPDGSADYIAHRPAELDKGVRWICRTPDQDALGMVLPATAEPEGYTAEKAKGNVKLLGAGASYHCAMIAGVLTIDEARAMEGKIEAIVA